ncbi:MAG TPA: hypothetical protein VK631_04270, partial [Solirubrobacteraceae bacterium]|nr:hypothetical protein [Solirubrobacteraceae bacterium]
RRKELAKSLEEARSHPEKVTKGLETRLQRAKLHPARNKELIKDLERQLAHAEAYPDRDKARIQDLREKIKGLDGDQRGRDRVRDSLKEKIIPALTGKRSSLNTARGDLLGNLDTVQGIGSPTNLMAVLPVTGVLGGDILSAQISIRDIGGDMPRVTDEAGTAEKPDTSERDALLEQLLREANLRTAVSESQFKVLRDMPPYGGSFDTGGVVPGPVGAPRTIVAHGGEGVFTPDQMAAGGQPSFVVIVQDGAVREDKIKVIAGREAERITRQQARAGARGLPGRGGGGLG